MITGKSRCFSRSISSAEVDSMIEMFGAYQALLSNPHDTHFLYVFGQPHGLIDGQGRITWLASYTTGRGIAYEGSADSNDISSLLSIFLPLRRTTANEVYQ